MTVSSRSCVAWLVPMLLVLTATCTERDLPFQATAARPQFDIQDGARSGGNPHFFFLPPMVPAPSYSGTTDPTQSPVVIACQWVTSGSSSACGTIVAFFSMSTGTGSEVVRYDASSQTYIVNWHTDQCVTGPCTLPPGNVYRIRVLVGGTELGHADVQVVANQQQAKNVTTGEFFALLDGRTLPIKFRIEQGAVFVVGPSTQTQTIQTPTTSAGSSVRLVIPAGDVSQPTVITVLPATLPSGTATTALAGGTAYDFGPTGTVFASPITVVIQYNPANIPSGMAESTVRLFRLVNGYWVLVPGSRVNTATHAVTGATSHFSTYGVLASASVSAGLDFTCGIGVSGTTVCWGDNSYGELGNGRTTSSGTPVVVSGGLTFATVSGVYLSSCGVTTGDAAYCWGWYNGLVSQTVVDSVPGDSSTQTIQTSPVTQTSPVAVLGGLSFATVSAGGQYHTCGIATAGAAYCWGGNSFGELGDGTTTDRASPVPVQGGLSFATVGAGSAYTCGVTTAGAAYCWGYGGNGELGDGTTTNRVTSPVAVAGGLSFATVSVGGSHTCGVTTAGAAYCWGSNSGGELGDGDTTGRASPVAVLGGLSFTMVSAGWGTHTCGVTTGGAAYCWGYNGLGELGDGTTTLRTSPVVVLGGLTFATVSVGGYHTCGIASAPSTNTAYCWGDNELGQLGDGTTTSSATPVLVSPLP